MTAQSVTGHPGRSGGRDGLHGTGRQWCHTDNVNGMAPRGRTTKKITITLPIEDAEAVERLAESGQIESVSRYVTEAVAFRRAREDGLAVLDRRFGKPPDYALEWARNLIARRLGSQGPAA
jgi:Arc/MetJ-type ribon-helix-helix transcriptional regulator